MERNEASLSADIQSPNLHYEITKLKHKTVEKKHLTS